MNTTEETNMLRQTFPDGSTIDTDKATGNRTVFGAMAHKEYFKILENERITANTSPAIIAYCKTVDGTRKAELIRKHILNPITRSFAGDYSYELWVSDAPDSVVRYMSEGIARAAFKAACMHGTNGQG